jgi:ParB family chromosome partitioning protein
MSRRPGLGKGLGALIGGGEPTAPEPAPNIASDHDVPVDVPVDAQEGSTELEQALGAVDDAEERSIPTDGPSSAAAPTIAAPAPTAAAAAAAPAPISVQGIRLIEVDPTLVQRNPRQPRDVFDQEEIDQLATSLLDVGMLQPLVVRPIAGDRYELVAGERRMRAAIAAGLPTVPAIVRATEDADLLKEALVENIHRVQLNPLEEAAAYQQLLEDFGVTQEELASRLGRSRPVISNTIRLLTLPPGVQRRIAAGVITSGHAKALLSLPNAATQQRLADRVVAEGLSVRATEEAARLIVDDLPPDDGGSRRGGGARQRINVPGLVELQDDLSDALEARVRISMGARKGKLTVEFLSVDDLERIVGVIADGLGSAAPGSARRGSDTLGAPAIAGTRPDVTDDTDDAASSEALADRKRIRFDDLVDLEGIRRATDLSDVSDLDD